MSTDRKRQIELLIKQFMKETFAKNMRKYTQKKEEGESGFSEVFDMFKDFADMIIGDDNTVDIKEEVVEESESSGRAEEEIKHLKEQIEMLKQQLRDKEEIIHLLKKNA